MSGRAPRLEVAEERVLLAAVVSSVARERAAAHTRIFEVFREPLFRLCLHLCGNRATAEDALQETFVSVFRALPGFRADARLSTWMYRIAVREALRHRAREVSRRVEGMDEEPAAPLEGNPAIRREESDALRRALGQLSADHRAVLSLFAVDGLSHREIGEILGVPEGTIWSRLHAARKRLAASLDADRPPTEDRS
ncbi:MAG TPA: RNA polymerase sigma factor [Kofleriaceae bacterium]|nr:RNA polymerase sigma factor [Kofleriaceae bacterium]